MNTLKSGIIRFLVFIVLAGTFRAGAQSTLPERPLLDVSLEDHLAAAQNYMQAQRWDFASYEWRTALAQNPKNLKATLGLGEALCRSGLVNEAISQLEQARLAIPANIQKSELVLALARAYLQANNATQAEHLYEEVLGKDPYNSPAIRGLVSVRKKLPSPQQAQVKRLLSQKSAQSKALWKKAIQTGQYLDAARALETVVIVNPTAKLLNDYGLSLLMAGQFPVAAKVFEVLKHQDNSWRTAANAGIVSLSLGNTYQAQQEMEQAIARAPAPSVRARLYNDLGYIYESARKTTKARFAYERAVGLEPGFTKAQMNLGYIYQKDRDFEQAVNLFKGLTERQPQNVAAWNQLGFSYELQHKEKQALSSYKEAVRLNPAYKDAYYNLGTLYRKLDKVDLASAAFKKMTDIEFNEIEMRKKSAQSTPQPELFKYIDLFLIEHL